MWNTNIVGQYKIERLYIKWKWFWFLPKHLKHCTQTDWSNLKLIRNFLNKYDLIKLRVYNNEIIKIIDIEKWKSSLSYIKMNL